MIDVETYAAAKAYTDSHGGGSGDGDMKKSVYDSDLAVANAGGISAFVSDAVSGKVDKVEGKGLSTNDYDNTEKGKVADNAGAIEAIVNVTGAKNVLPVTLDGIKSLNTDGTWSGSVYSYNGIDYTVQTDSQNRITGINVNGTASSRSILMLAGSFILSKDTILTGCPVGGGDSYFIWVESSISPYTNYAKDSGNGYEITSDNITNPCVAYINVRSGVVVNNAVFYPMLRDARITDPTYVPYAMTNRELTERVTSKSVTVTPESGYELTFNHLRVANDILYGEIALFGTDNLPTREWVTIATCDIRPSHDIYTSLFSSAEGLSGGLMIITQSGNIMVFQSYYDPIGTVTKKGAGGVFSSSL